MPADMTPLLAPSAAPGQFQPPPYTASSTNMTFQYATNMTDFAAGQRACNLLGGHLATFKSLEEQTEVEEFYISGGYLFPKFRNVYWMGLRLNSTTEPRKYTWIDPSLEIQELDQFTDYMHWGSSAGQQEPNNLHFPPEMCTSGNFTQAFEGAAGWADANCGMKYPIMCRLARRWHSSCSRIMLYMPPAYFFAWALQSASCTSARDTPYICTSTPACLPTSDHTVTDDVAELLHAPCALPPDSCPAPPVQHVEHRSPT
jgi:hypothetical protein